MTKHVLIVEDDHVLRRLFHDVLIHFDCHITEAPTLEAAYLYLEDCIFDFVLCDIHLREGDTIEIVQSCLDADMPVIIVSSDDSYVKPLGDKGVSAFLVKPVHIPDLIEIVENFEALQIFRTIRYPD